MALNTMDRLELEMQLRETREAAQAAADGKDRPALMENMDRSAELRAILAVHEVRTYQYLVRVPARWS